MGSAVGSRRSPRADAACARWLIVPELRRSISLGDAPPVANLAKSLHRRFAYRILISLPFSLKQRFDRAIVSQFAKAIGSFGGGIAIRGLELPQPPPEEDRPFHLAQYSVIR